MSRLAVYLLGPPRIEHDGVAIKLDRRKAMALLAYLAVSGHSHRRDSLANLLWPDYDATRGRAALRRTLHALSTALGSEYLDADREEVTLRPGDDASSGCPPLHPAQPRPALWVDVAEFRRGLAACTAHGHPATEVCLSCVGPLTEAVALVHGEFLSGFSLKDSFEFDDWQLFQAEALRKELAGALDRLIGYHSARRQFETAIGYARHRLALDPLDESTHQQLMRLYTWSGRRSAALGQYKECAAVLNEQLGVPPQETTRRLHDNIQAGRAPSLPDAPEPAAEPPSFIDEDQVAEKSVFVAREYELARLDACLDLALAGRGRVVLVTGEAGAGKTTLVQEFTRHAQTVHPTLIVATGNCNAHTGIGDPYLPFREILELMTGDVESRWAAGAMTRDHVHRLWHALPLTAQALLEAGPDLIDTFVSSAGLLQRATTRTGSPRGADWLTHLDERVKSKPPRSALLGPQQTDLFEQYTRVLQIVARQVPLMLVVDDLQWADLGSISLLFHLGRRLAGSRILVVGAYRPEEVAAGREGQRHPLDPVVNELQRSLGDISVNLDQAESRDFLEALLDSEPNRLGVAFREMLYRQTRGHPLFTIELLRGLQERGDLVQDAAGRWVEAATLNWEALPARVEAAIRERIGRLAEPLQAALQVASVEGEVFTAEVVTRVLGADERAMVQRLSSELDRRHRLVGAQAIERLGSRRVSRYRFRNYLFQKYLYDSLDQVERTYLHEGVGNVLEELCGDQAGDIAVQLARHFQEAGFAEKAIHYLHQAGDRAVQLSAYQEGLAHITRALALLMTQPHSPQRDRQELDLQLSLGVAMQGARGTQSLEMRDAYIRARELCVEIGETSLLCRVLGVLALHHYTRGEQQTAHDFGQQAVGMAQRIDDSLLEALTRWNLGVVLFNRGDYNAAHAHLARVIAFYIPQQHHRPFLLLTGSDAGVSALAYTACTLWCLGYPDQALQHSQKALALARELSHPFSLADVLAYAGCLFSQMRRDAQALKANADELVRLADEKITVWQGTGECYLGGGLAMLGQVQEGLEQLHKGIACLRSRGVRIFLSAAFASLVEAQKSAGRPAEGLTTLAEALAFVAETGERHYEAELHRLRAELLLMQGHRAEAEASLHTAIEITRRQGARSWQLRATTSLARLWQHEGKIDEARETLGAIYGWFTEGFDTPDLSEARALLAELS